MATFHDAAPGTMLLAVKGAHVVIGLCSSTVDDDGRPQPLDDGCGLLSTRTPSWPRRLPRLALASRVVDADRVPTDPASIVETGLTCSWRTSAARPSSPSSIPSEPRREAIGLPPGRGLGEDDRETTLETACDRRRARSGR
jgi:hypothetical protein